jgi:hypothetical protein
VVARQPTARTPLPASSDVDEGVGGDVGVNTSMKPRGASPLTALPLGPRPDTGVVVRLVVHVAVAVNDPVNVVVVVDLDAGWGEGAAGGQWVRLRSGWAA